MRSARLKSVVLNLLAAIGLLISLITFTPVVKLAVQASEPEWDDGNAEVLIILGGSMLVPGTGPQATLGYDTYLRTTFASWTLRTRGYRWVVVTGRGGLAEGMAKLLVENGADPHTILLERSAGSTFENATFSRRILQTKYKGRALPRVVVLTSDYHAWRARLTFRHCGFNAGAIPAPDLIKRSSEPAFRLLGAETLVFEWGKDIFYLMTGRA